MKWISGVWLLFSISAMAVVDLKNGNFSTAWTDLTAPGSGFEMKIQRIYNSKSLYNGIFGFGWCSEFETKLVVSPDNTLKIFECGAGLERTYATKDYGPKDIERLVQAIVQKVKSDGKRSEDYLASLRKNLIQDSNLRIRMALDYDLTAAAKEGTVYYANGKEVENVTLTKEYYVRQLVDGTLQRFDLKGRLIGLYDKNNMFVKMNYENSLLKEVSDNTGRRLIFKYNTNKRITSISGPSGIIAEYKFEKLDHLTWVNNAWGNVYTFEYDDQHNMVKATWPDKTFIQLTYEKTKDLVLSHKDRQGCLEAYSYEAAKDDPKLHYWSSVERKCGKDFIAKSKFEFIHKVRSDGATILAKTVTVTNGIVNEIEYHEWFGKPTFIKRPSEKIVLDYYPNGLLRTKSTPATRMAYDYDSKLKKISSVKTTFLDDKGKKLTERLSEFKYDPKGNLNFAKNTDGQKINLSYDGKGRIAVIEDQAKRVVKITYEEKFGKPSVVTRPQLGLIKISYKPNGDLDKAESPDGPQVAVQVASTFNNLLDVIAPASAELFN